MDDLGLVEAVDGFGESIGRKSRRQAIDRSRSTPVSARRSVYLMETYWADSSGSSQHLDGSAMNIRKRRSGRSGRVRLFSPGRPLRRWGESSAKAILGSDCGGHGEWKMLRSVSVSCRR